MSGSGFLIRLEPDLIVSPSHIAHASRCGHYTFVQLNDGNLGHQIWDEDKAVWNQIEAATVAP